MGLLLIFNNNMNKKEKEIETSELITLYDFIRLEQFGLKIKNKGYSRTIEEDGLKKDKLKLKNKYVRVIFSKIELFIVEITKLQKENEELKQQIKEIYNIVTF